jgi:hypothetical protein
MKKPVGGNDSSRLTLLLVLLAAAVTSCTGPTEPTRPAISAEILAAVPTSYSRAITIDYTRVPGTDQKNFPVLVSGTYDGQNETPDLRWTGKGGKVQNANGYDVGFYTSSTCSRGKLKWETERYNALTGEVAYWVRVPVVYHTQNTVFYLCYGNAGITSNQAQPSAVWDSHYLTVWHLADKGAGLDLSNSADTKYALTNSGQVSSAPGKIGGGTNKFALRDSTLVTDPNGNYYTYSYDYLDNPTVTLAKNGPLTISFWKLILASDGYPENKVIDGNHISAAMGADHDQLNSMTVWAPFFCDASWNYALEGPNLVNQWCGPPSYYDRWVYVTVVFNPAAGRFKGIYLDGVLVGSTINGATTTANIIGFRLGQDRIGHGPDPSQFDEVRISNSVRTADWIKAEFNNQNDPASFYAIGAEIVH